VGELLKDLIVNTWEKELQRSFVAFWRRIWNEL
jgi:hypothetical protein